VGHSSNTGANRRWRRWRYSSNLHHRCRGFPLSATTSPSTVHQFVSAQPHMDDASRPLSDRIMVAQSSLSGSPVTMRFYVRILAPHVALVCPHVLPPPLFLHPQDPNDPTTYPGNRWTCLLMDLHLRRSDPEAPWPPRRPRPRAPRDIMAFPCPLSDHLSERSQESRTDRIASSFFPPFFSLCSVSFFIRVL
jgi:hypothetical protein